jgi:hypothetical protein
MHEPADVGTISELVDHSPALKTERFPSDINWISHPKSSLYPTDLFADLVGSSQTNPQLVKHIHVEHLCLFPLVPADLRMRARPCGAHAHGRRRHQIRALGG